LHKGLRTVHGGLESVIAIVSEAFHALHVDSRILWHKSASLRRVGSILGVLLGGVLVDARRHKGRAVG
jgi:hypothetical protein